MTKCHILNKQLATKNSILPIVLLMDVHIKNLDDPEAPEEYKKLAKEIINYSDHPTIGPAVLFRIQQFPDHSYTAAVISSTSRYPFPTSQPLTFSGRDYYTCLQNQCFEKIVLDLFGFDEKILNAHYISI